MNKTRLSESFGLPLSASASEDVVVASAFTHPVRGRVVCPAASLVAAWLIDKGCTASVRDLGAMAVESPEPSGEWTAAGRLAVTSYLDLDGRAVGIAVAGGAATAHLAQDAVERWSSTLRTRRALVALVPRLCPAGRGSAARIPLPPQAASRTWGACRTVSATRNTVASYLERGDSVLLLDPRTHRDHGAGPVRVRSGEVVEVGSLQAVARLVVEDEARMSFVLGPCSVVEEVAPLLRALRERFPGLRGQHPDQWCYSSSDRQATIRAVAESSDLTLFVGNSEPPTGLPPGPGRVLTVRSLADISPEEIGRAATIGLIEADDGPPTREEKSVTLPSVLEVLAGVGPLSIVHRRVQTDMRTNIYERSLSSTR
ncbi:hypothetical protein [Streptomyces sp. NPDC002640]